jgi:hypothetical protein
MRCRNCGIEIADKAIVCYRCGTATTEPKFKPPTAAVRRVWTTYRVLLVILAALIVADVVVWFAGNGGMRTMGWVATAIVAVVVLLVRYSGRRRSGKLGG